jgi:hypothetical protein
MLCVSTIYLRLPPIYPSLGYAPLPPPPNQSELCFDRDPPAPPPRPQPPPPTQQTATSLCSSDSRPLWYSHPEATFRPYKLFQHRQDTTRVELLLSASLARKQQLVRASFFITGSIAPGLNCFPVLLSPIEATLFHATFSTARSIVLW